MARGRAVLLRPRRLIMQGVVAQGLGVEDEMIPIDDTPEHEELCERQAARLYDAITTNADLTSHLHDAVESLRIVSTHRLLLRLQGYVGWASGMILWGRCWRRTSPSGQGGLWSWRRSRLKPRIAAAARLEEARGRGTEELWDAGRKNSSL